MVDGDFNRRLVFKAQVRNAHGRRTRSGHQLVEWAQGQELRFLLSFARQACRDTWFHPKNWTGHPIDHLLCSSIIGFLGATTFLFEETIGASWSGCTDHHVVEFTIVEKDRCMTDVLSD